MTDAEIIARMTDLRELLKEFGAMLGGYDPGITAFLQSTGCSLHFDQAEWGWMEPLLIELHKYRLKRDQALRERDTLAAMNASATKDLRQAERERDEAQTQAKRAMIAAADRYNQMERERDEARAVAKQARQRLVSLGEWGVLRNLDRENGWLRAEENR